MGPDELESLREQMLRVARQHLVEGSSKQYWKFWRADRGERGPLLVISKPGRRVVHIKRVAVLDSRWRFIAADDPKNIGETYELRLSGNSQDVRAAFDVGFAAVLGAI